MFKTSGGKYIAPQLLENAMKQSRFIEQIMVIGEGEKMPVALIQPNFDFIKDWIKHKDKAVKLDNASIQNSEVVLARIQKEIDKANEHFGKWEQIKQFALLSTEWSIDGGEFTPKLSLKRKVILEKNKEVIEKIYKDAENYNPNAK